MSAYFQKRSALSLFLATFVLIAALFSTDQVEGAEGSCLLRPFIRAFLDQNSHWIGQSRQLIFATNKDASSSSVLVRTLQNEGRLWERVFSTFGATIGENGFAPFDRKKEGDGRSPTGIFSLGTAFGYGSSVATKMPYRQATENDFWVDDPDSEDYNTWVSGQPKAASMEKMKREDDLYKYGIVIEYNTNPIVKGKGSAIFLHLWRGEGRGSSGCVAMAEDKILRLLNWLDPAKKPLIILGAEAELLALRPR